MKTYKADSYKYEDGLPVLDRSYKGMDATAVAKLGFTWTQRRRRSNAQIHIQHNGSRQAGYLVTAKQGGVDKEHLIVSVES